MMSNHPVVVPVFAIQMTQHIRRKSDLVTLNTLPIVMEDNDPAREVPRYLFSWWTQVLDGPVQIPMRDEETIGVFPVTLIEEMLRFHAIEMGVSTFLTFHFSERTDDSRLLLDPRQCPQHLGVARPSQMPNCRA